MTFRLQRTDASAACVNRSCMRGKKKVKEFVTIATNSRVFGHFLAGSTIKKRKVRVFVCSDRAVPWLHLMRRSCK